MTQTALTDIGLHTLAGEPATLGGLGAKVLLVVNVASKCGLTPQYEGLERLHRRYVDRGFTVVGFPCNQFAGQEPGSEEEIARFCSTAYGVSVPMFTKIEVNGPNRHPVYAELTRHPDADGEAGDVQWNFEKFLIDDRGRVLARFRPRTEPESAEIIEAVETALARA